MGFHVILGVYRAMLGLYGAILGLCRVCWGYMLGLYDWLGGEPCLPKLPNAAQKKKKFRAFLYFLCAPHAHLSLG